MARKIRTNLKSGQYLEMFNMMMDRQSYYDIADKYDLRGAATVNGIRNNANNYLTKRILMDGHDTQIRKAVRALMRQGVTFIQRYPSQSIPSKNALGSGRTRLMIPVNMLVEIYEGGAKNGMSKRVIDRLNGILEGRITSTRQMKHYFRAAQIIRDRLQIPQSDGEHLASQVPQVPQSPVVKESRQDAVDILQQCFDQLQQAIVLVVNEQADERAQEVVREKQVELEALKTKYEGDIARLEVVLEEAKKSNLAATLRKSFKLIS